MSSLMGEWGMLQQLQGLVNVFTITSPSMVEWVDLLFAAVHSAKPWASSRAGASTPSKSTARPSSAADPNGPGTGGVAGRVVSGLCVGVEDLELNSLEAALQVRVSTYSSGGGGSVLLSLGCMPPKLYSTLHTCGVAQRSR